MSENTQPHDPKSVDLSRIIGWYQKQCDGEWEHANGISIGTLDNPGWILKVSLLGTDLEGAEMPPLSEGCEPDLPIWIDCSIHDDMFVGACDPTQLPRLIALFNRLIDARQE